MMEVCPICGRTAKEACWHGIPHEENKTNPIIKRSSDDFKKGFLVALKMIDVWIDKKIYTKKEIGEMLKTAILLSETTDKDINQTSGEIHDRNTK
jgi:hypothetical protein